MQMKVFLYRLLVRAIATTTPSHSHAQCHPVENRCALFATTAFAALLFLLGVPGRGNCAPQARSTYDNVVIASADGCVAQRQFTEFPIPTAASGADGITAGPDGGMWFTEAVTNKIGRSSLEGSITEYSDDDVPNAITAGPDGNLWFTVNRGNKIGRITTSGQISVFPIPSGGQGGNPSSGPARIATGPDGALWFTEQSGFKIGRITTSGVFSEYPVLTLTPPYGPYGITAGPDGNLWFTEMTTAQIGRITPSGVITEFPLPSPGSLPLDITAGADGALWFAEYGGNRIGRITVSGSITEFSVPTPTAGLTGMTLGTDGNVWFTENLVGKIGRITPAGAITELEIPTPGSGPSQITSGPDGNLWFTEYGGNAITRFELLPILRWPLDGALSDYRVAEGRWDYDWIRDCGGLPKKHVGLDLSLDAGLILGKRVYAAFDGFIVARQNVQSGLKWGDVVVVEHLDAGGNRFTTAYLHIASNKKLNPRTTKKEGTHVNKGQMIGEVAQVSDGINPHLHFSIRRAPFDTNISLRGALPFVDEGDCHCTDDRRHRDPVFPEFFIDPSLTFYDW
jgi:streptogramin lyase